MGILAEVEVDSRNGPPPVFTADEEEAMAKWLSEMDERDFGLNPEEFWDFVESLVKRENRKTPLKNNRPDTIGIINF